MDQIVKVTFTNGKGFQEMAEYPGCIVESENDDDGNARAFTVYRGDEVVAYFATGAVLQLRVESN